MSELLEVRLDNFEGPLDLLIHLIYKDEMNIYDISISDISERFIAAIRQMEEMDLEIAAEFITMASYLIYLKSRMLLPRDSMFDEEMDPEEEKYMFTQRLIEYSFYKDVAGILGIKAGESSRYIIRSETLLIPKEEMQTEDPYQIASSFFEMLAREKKTSMTVEKDTVDLGTVIEQIRSMVIEQNEIYWTKLAASCNNRLEVAVSLLAVLELMKLKVATALQPEPFGEIYIKKMAS